MLQLVKTEREFLIRCFEKLLRGSSLATYEVTRIREILGYTNQ